jgi:segregation and condensation protein B
MEFDALTKDRVKNIIESLLLVAKKPLLVKEVEQVVGLSAKEIEESLQELCFEYENKGMKIFKVAHGYQLATNPDNAEFVAKFTDCIVETTLSPSSMETLAIIAYKQPIVQPDIERMRGVDSGSVIQTLLNKRLIKEKGRSDAVGRPYIYVTTDEFLKHFGLKDLRDLPPLPEDLAEKEEAYPVEEEIIAERIEPAIFKKALPNNDQSQMQL